MLQVGITFPDRAYVGFVILIQIEIPFPEGKLLLFAVKGKGFCLEARLICLLPVTLQLLDFQIALLADHREASRNIGEFRHSEALAGVCDLAQIHAGKWF